MKKYLRVYSIFPSIDGEVNHFYQGRLTVFVRLAGCNLQCKYCDTQYAAGLNDGKDMSIDSIIDTIVSYRGIGKVTITGGEPFLQQDLVWRLCSRLSNLHRQITIETNGSIKFKPARSRWPGTKFIVDYKLPSSGQGAMMDPEVFYNLLPSDFVKFVIADRADFDRAVKIMGILEGLGCLALFAFSPVFDADKKCHFAADLLRWMMEFSSPKMVLNIQLHKVVNFDEPK